MRLHLDHHKDESRTGELGRQCAEVAARCRALDGRLKSFGVIVEIPEFKPPKLPKHCGWGLGPTLSARRKHNLRVERLLLGALSLVLQQLPDGDGRAVDPE